MEEESGGRRPPTQTGAPPTPRPDTRGSVRPKRIASPCFGFATHPLKIKKLRKQFEKEVRTIREVEEKRSPEEIITGVPLRRKKSQGGSQAAVSSTLSTSRPASSLFSCPILGCPGLLRARDQARHSNNYYIAKHLISQHLKRGPCPLYPYFTPAPGYRFPCPSCSFTSSSQISLFAHSALEHRELHQLLGRALGQRMVREEEETYHSIDTFWKREWGRWKELSYFHNYLHYMMGNG